MWAPRKVKNLGIFILNLCTFGEYFKAKFTPLLMFTFLLKLYAMHLLWLVIMFFNFRYPVNVAWLYNLLSFIISLLSLFPFPFFFPLLSSFLPFSTFILSCSLLDLFPFIPPSLPLFSSFYFHFITFFSDFVSHPDLLSRGSSCAHIGYAPDQRYTT